MAKILVIDDERGIRDFLGTLLRQQGYDVLLAEGGWKGLELFCQERPDLVVTDIFMPEKDGIEVILEMKKRETKTKIIAMSGGGRGRLDWRTFALSLGADRVLVKPFEPKTFLLAIQEVLAGSADTTPAVPPSSTTEQRKHTRSPAYFPVSFGDGTITRTSVVVNLSSTGCRIRCPDALPDLKYFQMEIRLQAPGEKLQVELAVKRWSRHGELGLEFIRMEPDHQARLQRVIRNSQ
jgi:DNA-binding response OmpR family regulator